MNKNGRSLDTEIKLLMLRKQYNVISARLDLQAKANVSLMEENSRLRSALTASSNAQASAAGRESELLDAMDGIINIFDEYAGVERHGPKGLGPVPYNNDAPCYYCTYRDASTNKDFVFKLDDVCQWCIHNPYGKLFEKTDVMISLRKKTQEGAKDE